VSPTIPILTAERTPTQVNQPRRATIRTVIAAIVGLIPVLPDVIRAYGLDSIPVIAAGLTIIAATARVLTLPQVEKWLQDYAPWLSANGKSESGQQ